MDFFSVGQLRTISAVLSNLAAGWFGSLIILPGFIAFKSPEEALSVLTYSLCFGILSMLVATRIEDYLYGK